MKRTDSSAIAATPETMTRTALEQECTRLHVLERDVRWIAAMPPLDLRQKLIQLDAEAQRIPREGTLGDTIRALLEYALAGIR